MAGFKNLEEYLYRKDKIFTIPNYQRGYKWAVKENGNESAVEILLNDLISAYKEKSTLSSYFLQGITVNEDDKNITLIDGQQRTTTLYLLLWCIGKEHIKNITINYEIRKKSHDFLLGLKENDSDSICENDNDNQDLYYFKEAIKQIKQKINEIDKKDFLKFLLEQVQILYINIHKDKATKIFTMMNGNKAIMLPEELIKAEMLRIISSNSDDDSSKEWEINMLRSRYAREWDKWLYWWNRKDVRDFFKIDPPVPMGLLLEYYYKKQKKNSKLDFNNFKKSFLISPKETKKRFKEIRDLQKSFEDIFNNPKIFNYLGLALNGNSKESDVIINYFIENKKDDEKIEEYAKWSLVGATYSEITDTEKDPEKDSEKINKAHAALQALSEDVYNKAYEDAAKQLLRLNVEEYNRLNKKFDFSIYEKRSLEHIHPQSKVDGLKLSEDDEWLEHSIGNLLLLHKDDNSKLSDKSFNEKKNIYFNINDEFKSRNLLHTISVFAISKWDKEEIKRNREKFIKRFKDDYQLGDDYVK